MSTINDTITARMLAIADEVNDWSKTPRTRGEVRELIELLRIDGNALSKLADALEAAAVRS